MALQIIGTGLGRTGTYSLKAALEQLGFGPIEALNPRQKALARLFTSYWLDATTCLPKCKVGLSGEARVAAAL